MALEQLAGLVLSTCDEISVAGRRVIRAGECQITRGGLAGIFDSRQFSVFFDRFVPDITQPVEDPKVVRCRGLDVFSRQRHARYSTPVCQITRENEGIRGGGKSEFLVIKNSPCPRNQSSVNHSASWWGWPGA